MQQHFAPDIPTPPLADPDPAESPRAAAPAAVTHPGVDRADTAVGGRDRLHLRADLPSLLLPDNPFGTTLERAPFAPPPMQVPDGSTVAVAAVPPAGPPEPAESGPLGTPTFDIVAGVERRSMSRGTPDRRRTPRGYASPWMAQPQQGALDPRPTSDPLPPRDQIVPLGSVMPEIPLAPDAGTVVHPLLRDGNAGTPVGTSPTGLADLMGALPGPVGAPVDLTRPPATPARVSVAPGPSAAADLPAPLPAAPVQMSAQVPARGTALAELPPPAPSTAVELAPPVTEAPAAVAVAVATPHSVPAGPAMPQPSGAADPLSGIFGGARVVADAVMDPGSWFASADRTESFGDAVPQVAAPPATAPVELPPPSTAVALAEPPAEEAVAAEPARRATPWGDVTATRADDPSPPPAARAANPWGDVSPAAAVPVGLPVALEPPQPTVIDVIAAEAQTAPMQHAPSITPGGGSPAISPVPRPASRLVQDVTAAIALEPAGTVKTDGTAQAHNGSTLLRACFLLGVPAVSGTGLGYLLSLSLR